MYFNDTPIRGTGLDFKREIAMRNLLKEIHELLKLEENYYVTGITERENVNTIISCPCNGSRIEVHEGEDIDCIDTRRVLIDDEEFVVAISWKNPAYGVHKY